MKINRKGTPAAPNHACVGPIAPYIGRFAKFLASEGYVAFTINAKLSLVTGLSRWLKRHGLSLVELDERTLKQFYNYGSASIACYRTHSCAAAKIGFDRLGQAYARL